MSMTAREIMQALASEGFTAIWGNTGGGVYNIIVMDGVREAVFISDNGEWTQDDEDAAVEDYGVTVYNHDGFSAYDMQRMVDIVAAVRRAVGPAQVPPTRNDESAYFGRTMTAGQLIDWLSKFPADMPVTIGVSDTKCHNCESYIGDWMNIDSASDPHETGEFSVILNAVDDFDTRQW